MLTVIDEYSRTCLAIRVARRLKSHDVLDVLSDLFITEGMPNFIRSDNGSEFTASALRDWLKALAVHTAYIEPGSPWENGYNESFNGKLRDDDDSFSPPAHHARMHKHPAVGHFRNVKLEVGFQDIQDFFAFRRLCQPGRSHVEQGEQAHVGAGCRPSDNHGVEAVHHSRSGRLPSRRKAFQYLIQGC
jgi:transposase InsO family protein